MKKKTNIQTHYESIKTLLEIGIMLNAADDLFDNYCRCEAPQEGIHSCDPYQKFRHALRVNIKDRLEWLIWQIDRMDMVDYKGFNE